MSNSQSHTLDLSIEELEAMDSPAWDAVVGVCVKIAVNVLIT